MTPTAAETFQSRFARFVFNFFPSYRRTSGRLTHITSDWHEVHIKVPLNWRTRNYFGTIFGGSMYGAIDPIYAVMLVRILGNDYVVWDKSAHIHFKKPGRSTLTAKFKLEKSEIEEIRQLTASGDPIDRMYQIELVDKDDVVCATCEKVVYIRRKQHNAKDQGHE